MERVLILHAEKYTTSVKETAQEEQTATLDFHASHNSCVPQIFLGGTFASFGPGGGHLPTNG